MYLDRYTQMQTVTKSYFLHTNVFLSHLHTLDRLKKHDTRVKIVTLP